MAWGEGMCGEGHKDVWSRVGVLWSVLQYVWSGEEKVLSWPGDVWSVEQQTCGVRPENVWSEARRRVVWGAR